MGVEFNFSNFIGMIKSRSISRVNADTLQAGCHNSQQSKKLHTASSIEELFIFGYSTTTIFSEDFSWNFLSCFNFFFNLVLFTIKGREERKEEKRERG